MIKRSVAFLFSGRAKRPPPLALAARSGGEAARWRRLIAAVMSLSIVAAAHAGPAGTFPQAAQRGTLRVGVVHVPPVALPGAKVRTPDRLDLPAIQSLSQALGLAAQPVQIAPEDVGQALAEGRVDLALYSLPDSARAAPGLTYVPTAYHTHPQAVIRSDTSIRQTADLRGRAVCLPRTAVAAAAAATDAGAQIQAFDIPSDALVAVREGKCDLGLLDQTARQALMAYPEWRKFAATLDLPAYARTLTWVLPAARTQEVDWLRRQMAQWDASGRWEDLVRKWATDVAFDVYLDQEVPDCHS